jgi:hypothetical protein
MKKTLKEQAHEHYQKMIDWAKEQPKEDIKDSEIMLREIGEDWFSDCCPYCNKYLSIDGYVDDCGKCPLNLETDGRGMEYCCGDIWDKVQDVITWKEWIKWAKKIDKFIQKKG